MKSFWRQLRGQARSLMFAVPAGAIAVWLLTYHLQALTYGHLSKAEQPLLTPVASLHHVVHNPLFLPLQILRLIAALVPYHGIVATRLPNVVLGLLTLAAYTLAVRYWYGPRTAYYGLVLLAVAPWFLHIARLATYDICYPLAILATFLFYAAWQRSESMKFLWLSPLFFGLLLYIPGYVWFFIISLVWQRHLFPEAWQKLSTLHTTLWALMWPFYLSILGYSFWLTPTRIITWIGLPQHFHAPLHILKEAGAVWLHIFIRGPQDPLLGLGLLPLLNIFVTAMVAIGAYFYVSHWRAARSRMLLVVVVLSTILTALQGPVTISILLPLVYVLAAGGLGYLLYEWFSVFPRNPLAKVLGYSLVGIVLAFSTFYNLRQYFVAWPRTNATRASFREHP